LKESQSQSKEVLTNQAQKLTFYYKRILVDSKWMDMTSILIQYM